MAVRISFGLHSSAKSAGHYPSLSTSLWLKMLDKTFLVLLFPLLALAQQSAKVYTACRVPMTAAPTFDDGPYKYMTQISDALSNKSAKGTFFVNGYNYDCIYDKRVAARLKYTYASGHQISSYTWSHPDLTTLNESAITDEFVKIDVALKKILGVTPFFFRPPYGNYNSLVRQVAFQQNKSLVLWDFDSEDSIGATVEESESYYDAVINSSVSTLLALNHETENTTAHVLVQYAIDKLQAANYSLVTVSECLGIPPYSSVEEPGTRDDTWFCPEEDSDD
ncbi:carbohydrate esterase family 4 protein [Mycena galericulata]|nr:carbohydrate esterase family 4 protein [Mycena galericulata]